MLLKPPPDEKESEATSGSDAVLPDEILVAPTFVTYGQLEGKRVSLCQMLKVQFYHT